MITRPEGLSGSSPATPSEFPWSPKYFVTRPDGTLSPLIAADELPPNAHIFGLPRTISMDETFNMMHVSTEERIPYPYADQPPDTTENSDHTGPKNHSHQAKNNYNTSNKPKKAGKAQRSVSWRRYDAEASEFKQPQSKNGEGVQVVQAAIDSIIQASDSESKAENFDRSVFHPIIPANDAGEKVAVKPSETPCRYWSRTGGCRNGDSCRFIHQQPFEDTSKPSRGWMDTYATNPFFRPDQQPTSTIRPLNWKGKSPLHPSDELANGLQLPAHDSHPSNPAAATTPPPVPIGTHPRNFDSSHIQAPARLAAELNGWKQSADEGGNVKIRW